MKYLVDTNIFFHTINPCIYEVAEKCRVSKRGMCVTNTILNELEPRHYHIEFSPDFKDVFTSVYNQIYTFKTIELISLSDVPKAPEELKMIRKRHYYWIKDPAYLKRLISQGVIKKEDIKSLPTRDLGECELVAIAKSSGGEYQIVTNDKGRVFAHPFQNVFSHYENDPDVVIINGQDWLEMVK